MLKLPGVEKTQQSLGLQIRSQHSFFTVIHADGSGSPGVDKSGLIFLCPDIPTLRFLYVNELLYKITSTCY